MSDAKMILVILLGLLAVVTGAMALWLLLDTLRGLGVGGLGFTGTPIGLLGVTCALSVIAIARILKGAQTGGK